MTALVQHTLTKAEREARRAERAAQKERERQAQEAALPDSVHGVPLTEMVYTAASKKELKAKRREFTPMRSAFLRDLAENSAPLLRRAGLSEAQIALMSKGKSPAGWNVHHKHPLGGGGKNEFANFIFIQNDPYHTDFHKVSDVQIRALKDGETRTIRIPVPQGSVFVPPERQIQNALLAKHAVQSR